MRPSEADFRAKLDAAREWERALAAWVRARGWYIVPTYDFTGGDEKAPKLLAPPGAIDLVLPDLQCFREGERRWLEVKWKARADWYRKGDNWTPGTARWVTGIASRLFRHYERVEKLTGQCAFVAFLHEREREIRGGSLAELRSAISHIDSTDRMQRGGMTFFRYEALPRWCALEAISIHRSTAA